MSVDYTGGKKETVKDVLAKVENKPTDGAMLDMQLPLDISTNNCTPIFLALLGAMVQNKGISFYGSTVNASTLKSRIDELKRAEKKILEALNGEV